MRRGGARGLCSCAQTHLFASVKPARPSQRDIAKAAKVTQATVSLALSNHPRVSPEMRTRIQAIAKKIGYEVDPYLAGLSAYKKQRRPASFQATLGWISNFPPQGRKWKTITTFVHYFEAAAQRASELGYKLEELDLAAPGMTPARMARILRTRNIPGLLFAPQPLPLTRLDFPFERFACATFGYTLVSPRLHTVTHHHFRTTETLIKTLRAHGYRRIGFALEADNDRRIERIPSSAFLSAQRDWPREECVPLLSLDDLNRESFLEWFDQYRPDVVVTLWDLVYPWLIEAGVRVPEDVGLALLSVRKRDGFFAGMWENPELVGARAAELVVNLVQHGERGVPETPSYLLIEGKWLPGKTIRAQEPR